MKIRSLLAAVIVCASALVAAPAQAAGQEATISVPDVDILTNACSTTPITVSVAPGTDSTHYKVTVLDPTGREVAGLLALNYGASVSMCASDVAGAYTVRVDYDSIEFGSGTASKTFVVAKPQLEVLTAAAARHAGKPRKVTARLAIRGQSMTGRRVLVTSNGHRSYRTTDAAGRVSTRCKASKRCRITFSYDGFVTSRTVVVHRRHRA